MTAYEHGWQSADAGALITECPFHPKSAQATEWRNGFAAFIAAFLI